MLPKSYLFHFISYLILRLCINEIFSVIFCHVHFMLIIQVLCGKCYNVHNNLIHCLKHGDVYRFLVIRQWNKSHVCYLDGSVLQGLHNTKSSAMSNTAKAFMNARDKIQYTAVTDAPVNSQEIMRCLIFSYSIFL